MFKPYLILLLFLTSASHFSPQGISHANRILRDTKLNLELIKEGDTRRLSYTIVLPQENVKKSKSNAIHAYFEINAHPYKAVPLNLNKELKTQGIIPIPTGLVKGDTLNVSLRFMLTKKQKQMESETMNVFSQIIRD